MIFKSNSGLNETRFVVFHVIAPGYGYGVYFARDASYSLGYEEGASGGRAVYLARVLVGDYCQGHPGFLQPNQKEPNKSTILYDSVVDNISIPTIFVVFNVAQCYPEYIIRF